MVIPPNEASLEADWHTGAAPEPAIIFAPAHLSSNSARKPLTAVNGQANGIAVPPSSLFTPMPGDAPRKTRLPSRHYAMGLAMDETAFDDSITSPETSFMNPKAASFPFTSSALPSLTLNSNSLFTPEATHPPPRPVAPAPHKRSRPTSAASNAPSVPSEPPIRGRLNNNHPSTSSLAPNRTRTGGPSLTTTSRKPTRSASGESISGASTSTVRRSTRLTRESDKGKDSLSARPRVVSQNPREKKRAKAAMSDDAATTLSNPRSSSSPEPSLSEEAAEDWVRDTFRRFGRATAQLSRYNCTQAIEALDSMPVEQRTSWRALVLLGRAHFENLNYEEVRPASSTFCHASC